MKEAMDRSRPHGNLTTRRAIAFLGLLVLPWLVSSCLTTGQVCRMNGFYAFSGRVDFQYSTTDWIRIDNMDFSPQRAPDIFGRTDRTYWAHFNGGPYHQIDTWQSQIDEASCHS